MSESEPIDNYPGINRLHYFLGYVGMLAAVVFAIMIFGPGSRVMEFLTLPLLVVGLVLDVLRLRNTGLSQWFAFVRFVPFGNTVLAIFLFSAQPGWVEDRRWDSTGRNVLIFFLFLFVLMFLLFLRLSTLIPVSFWDLIA
jgi:hypothetical protein